MILVFEVLNFIIFSVVVVFDITKAAKAETGRFLRLIENNFSIFLQGLNPSWDNRLTFTFTKKKFIIGLTITNNKSKNYCFEGSILNRSRQLFPITFVSINLMY